MMLGRTMILELNVARLQGLLQGDSANERFRSFIQRLQQPDIALSLLQEYPVLARQIVICIDQWVNYSLEFIQNLCTDWEAIRTMFSPEADPGMLVQVVGGGDQHGGGRTVLIAKFSSGFQIVYKPKALAVNMHFQELLAWLNEHGDLSFRTVKVLERGRHGWVEFVTPQTCTSQEEIQL